MNISKKYLQSKTILIVDDTPNILGLIFNLLKNTGYKVLIARDGKKAIKTALIKQPDLILLDVIMPFMDGFDTCNHLKRDLKTKEIPVIFMTALVQTEEKVRGFALGAVDYITKPIEEEELLARIKTHLSIQSLHQRLVRDTAKQKLLSQISDRIRKSLNLNLILDTATKEIRGFLNCDCIRIISQQEESISIEASDLAKGLDTKLIDTISYKDMCSSSEEYKSYLLGNIQDIELEESSSYLSKIPTTKPSARLIVPILIEYTDTPTVSSEPITSPNIVKFNNILWGWLVADQYQSSKIWQVEDTKLLQELTTQLAIGIKQGKLYKQLSELALLDSLTRIYNRRFFDQQLTREWKRLKRISAPLSLIMCDIDYFKVYNDTYGHQQGDKCLQQVVQAISSSIKRPGDILARYGGEEFAIILPQTHDAGAAKIGENIRTAIKKLEIPHRNSLVDSIVTVSVGVATTIPNVVDNPELLIEAADLALYQAKDHGRDCVLIYPDSISHTKNREELKIIWVKRLRQALKQNLFSLYAQSITPLKKHDSCTCFEILLRLTDIKDEVIPPGVFLDVAERNFMMIDIDTWVINNLFETLEKFDRYSWENHRFSVNLSGSSLNNESFLQFIKNKLNECSLPPSLFCFEITESVAVSNLARIVEFINSLKKIGCSFALDDFGKGVSSLTYLQNLPVDYLKIDGSFIKGINVNPSSKVMVEAINHIAEGIGLKTVAEFVEDEHILNSVRDLNVDYAQGFHFSHPSALIDVISAKVTEA